VTAILGVMKSGAAYVPIDPAYPQARLRTLLEDADPIVLVTTERISADLPTFAARALYIDQEAACSGPEEGNLTVPVGPDDIAYVMYTSGSTGIPKGVLVTHGGVSNHLCWRSSYFPVEPSDRCLQTASLSFDASVWQILEPLSAGACLTLTRPCFEYDSTYLVKLMLEQSITVACFVPSQLEIVIEQPDIGRCRSLRRLTTGGERLSVTLQRRVHERLPATALYNGYGPTEATIASLYWKCLDIPEQSSVPIGRPIANTQVYILDRHLQLVPAGVIGEICIGGAGVAHGYLNRPELTAERFVDDALGAASASKLYRTGDLGRVRADGVFEFVGRVDDQVKIRGVRVQLGEIEAAILCHPDVRSTAVVCTATTSGTRLTAYVVPRGSDPICAAQLRAFVGERIPPALIPNRFESIRALPLTSSGKLDRRSLPDVSADEQQKTNHIAPRSDLEARLVRLWEETIQTRPIGIRDDFFELGGHSLSAVQIAANIERMLGRSVSPGLLFEAPTIEMLASRISTFSLNDASGAFVPLLRGPTGAALFLVHHVSGDITAYRDLARYLGGKRPVYGVRAPELDSNKEPPDRVEALASRYVREMRVLQTHGPYLIGGHSAGAHIAFEMAQQLRAAGEHVALLAILEADARTPSRLQSFADAIRFQFEAIRSLPGRQRGLYLWRRFVSWTDQRGKIAPVYLARSPSTEAVKNAVWTAIERAVRNYRPRPYPGSVTLFRATDRRVTRTYTRTLGWGRLARGGIRVIDVAGTHSTVLRPGSEPPMAAKLRACLDELTAGEKRAPSALDIRLPPDEPGTGPGRLSRGGFTIFSRIRF
jgi:amino acid adenylation domain-containing protein